MQNKFVWKYIESDYYRLKGNAKTQCDREVFRRAHIVLFALFGRVPAFTYSFWFRLAKAKGVLGLIGRWRHYNNRRRYGVYINWPQNIGYGLYLPHPQGIVLNVTAKIGNNVTIHRGVNIGSEHYNAATIGNNVYIGPNVCIVEHVRIGNNVT